MNNINDKLPDSLNMDILASYSVFKEQRLRLYENIKKEIDNFDDWSIPVEKLLAYYIVARNIRQNGNILQAKVQLEIFRLTEGIIQKH